MPKRPSLFLSLSLFLTLQIAVAPELLCSFSRVWSAIPQQFFNNFPTVSADSRRGWCCPRKRERINQPRFVWPRALSVLLALDSSFLMAPVCCRKHPREMRTWKRSGWPTDRGETCRQRQHARLQAPRWRAGQARRRFTTCLSARKRSRKPGATWLELTPCPNDSPSISMSAEGRNLRILPQATSWRLSSIQPSGESRSVRHRDCSYTTATRKSLRETRTYT